MSRFHLMHCIPNRRMHGLNGYKEVIETVAWGLCQLGHQCSYAQNKYDPAAINIVFGAQVCPVETLSAMPDDTIVYNFEQIRGFSPAKAGPSFHYFAPRFRVWEYSAANLGAWASLGNSNVQIVPVGYAPILTRIPKREHQDIDVLIYGLTGQRRLIALHNLSQAGLVTLFVSGLYNGARDELIARSKIVLNVNLHLSAQIFEIVRVSYLLANSKAVVAPEDASTHVEDGLRRVIRFSKLETVVDDCSSLIEDAAERHRLEDAGLEYVRERDIRVILKAALGE